MQLFVVHVKHQQFMIILLKNKYGAGAALFLNVTILFPMSGGRGCRNWVMNTLILHLTVLVTSHFFHNEYLS